jgi:hypothetical protein
MREIAIKMKNISKYEIMTIHWKALVIQHQERKIVFLGEL